MGAERVIAVDYIDYRLEHARKHNKVETVKFKQHDNTGEYLKDLTHGGADMLLTALVWIEK